jgi:nucleotide-binding universal stress UspA family protein
MGSRHIVVAADESDASREAVRTALRWAARATARATVLTVAPLRATPALRAVGGEPGPTAGPPEMFNGVQRWLRVELGAEPSWAKPEVASAAGIPGIEITRFAEDCGADLLVLGRKRRSPAARLLVGDTADAVARRSRVPCLFVPGPTPVPSRILVAVDGTERGFTVLHTARRWTGVIDAKLDVVTVEPTPSDGEPGDLAGHLPAARSVNLEHALNRDGGALRIRRGDVVDEILREVNATGVQVLAVGYHRGGPPGVLEVGSVARRLAHVAPCAVLTIPL